MNTPMIDQAKAYVASRRGEWRAVADAAGISYDWLTKFMQGRIPEPGYYKIERLCRLARLDDTPTND